MRRDETRELRRAHHHGHRLAEAAPLRVADAALGGPGGGATITRARVYDDLPGYSLGGSGVVVTTARCLPMVRNAGGDGWDVDTAAAVIEAEPGFGIAIELGAADCCTCPPPAGQGLFISTPISTNNFVSPAEEGAVTVAGGGVHPSSTVKLTIGSLTVVDVTPDASGNWTYTGDISSLSGGPVIISAYELDLSGFSHKPRLAVITYGKAYDAGQLARVPAAAPTAPDLDDGSDTGLGTTDDITSDDTPTFNLETTTDVTATGPVPKLYVDGVLVATGTTTSFTGSNPGVHPAQLTSTTLSNGDHVITWTETDDNGSDTAESGHSAPLLITIDPNEGQGLVIATAQVNEAGDVAATDTEFDVDGITIVTNTTGNPDPSTSPVTIDQPSQPIAANDDDPVRLQYTGGEWVLLREPAYFREVLLTTIGGVQTITHVGPCSGLQTAAEIQALFDFENPPEE